MFVDGTIYFCTTNKELADAKQLSAVFACHFKGVFDPATDEITGSAKSEFYTTPDGKPENYARDSAKDPTIDLTLCRAGGKCGQPVAPPNTAFPTPTPDWRKPLNDSVKNTVQGVIDRDNAKNPPQGSAAPNTSPAPDTNPLLGINDTLDYLMKSLIWLVDGEPKNSSSPPPSQH